jgi:hypothetical protein
MAIDAMKLALEALEKCMYPQLKQLNAITALRTAIAEAEKQEAWKTSDTAYRPGGLPQDFIKHEVDSASDWSEWVCPDPTQYFMKCCDCGLVHEMQFKVVKYSAVDECEDVDDPNVQVVFRARRHEVAEKQEDSLAQTNWDNIPQAFNEWWNADYDDSTNPFRLNSPAYWAWSGWSAANKEKHMTTHITKTWFDGEKVVTQEIPESEVYKQEPVAWEDVLGAIARGWAHPENARKPMDVQLAVAIAKEIQDMYTTPPAAQRQPLTDEEIMQTWEGVIKYAPGEVRLKDFARAIEAAHGIGEKT